jgi:hypothetical protein
MEGDCGRGQGITKGCGAKGRRRRRRRRRRRSYCNCIVYMTSEKAEITFHLHY